jgi:hypothetical protein
MLGLVFIKGVEKNLPTKKTKKKQLKIPNQDKKTNFKKRKKYLVWFGFDFRKIKLIKPDQTKLI